MRREGSAVWRTAYRLVRNQADADECFQETFLAALEVSNRQPVRNWPALLQRLATSRAIDRVRKRLRRRRREEVADLALAEAAQCDPSQAGRGGRADQRLAVGDRTASHAASGGVLSARAGGLELSANCRSVGDVSQCRGRDPAPHAAKVAGTFENAESIVGRAETAAASIGSKRDVRTSK